MIFVIVLLGAIYAGIRLYQSKPKSSSPTSVASISPSPQVTATQTPMIPPNASALAQPVADFKAGVTKKPFGIYISPQNSPVQPERFTGYHTGADAEYADVTADVPVLAIADGTITYSQWTSGYGGCFILKADINGTPHSVLYGHIRPSTLPSVGHKFKKGGQIAVLGTAYSTETDGERRHLHSAILSNSRIDVKGYVSSESQLSGWLDPLKYYKYN